MGITVLCGGRGGDFNVFAQIIFYLKRFSLFSWFDKKSGLLEPITVL